MKQGPSHARHALNVSASTSREFTQNAGQPIAAAASNHEAFGMFTADGIRSACCAAATILPYRPWLIRRKQIGNRSATAILISAQNGRIPPSTVTHNMSVCGLAKEAPIAMGSDVPMYRPLALATKFAGVGACHTCSATVQNAPVSTTSVVSSLAIV